MTEQEAIEMLTLNDEMQKKLPNLKEAYEVAVKALEKQIPKEPDEDDTDFYCPCCERKYLNIYDNYCEDCGQKIDWSAEE